MTDLDATLERLCEVTHPLILSEGFGADCCILATRLTVEVLRERGHRTKPLPVWVRAYNAPYQRLVAENGGHPDLPTLEKWTTEYGAWALGIGYPEYEEVQVINDGRRDKEGYNGHLVTVVDDRYVLDASLGQASRPQRGMPLKAIWFAPPKEFFRGGSHALELTGDEGSTVVAYFPQLEERSYLTAGDWTASGFRRPHHNALLRKLRNLL